jgi:hypothetical protein
MILHSKNSGARYDCLPPGVCPRGLTFEQAAAFATQKRTRGACKFSLGPALPAVLLVEEIAKTLKVGEHWR